MLRPIVRKGLADLRAHRLQTGLVFFILAVSAATLTLALTVRGSADDPWGRAYARANGAHATFYTVRLAAGDELADFSTVAGLPGITGTAGPFWAIGGHALVRDGVKFELNLQAMPPTLPEVNRPIVTDGRWLGGDPGEIVLDRALARDAGVEVGDRVGLLADDGSIVEVTVAGVSVSPWEEPYPESTALSFAPVEVLERLAPDRGDWYATFSVRLADPDGAYPVWDAIVRANPRAHVVVETWHDVRDGVTYWNELNAFFLGLFSLFALVAVGLVIANVVGARVLAQFREIGLLKAVGFTPRQVAAIYLVQHLLIALAASLVGIAAGLAVAPLFLRRLAESMHTTAAPAVDPPVIAIVLAIVVGVVTLSTLVPAWRGGRVSTVGAISAGFSPARSRPSRLLRLATSLRLPAHVAFGLKDAFARPWRGAMTTAALVLTVITVVYTLGVDATFDRLFGEPALQGEPYDLRLDRDTRSDAETQAILAANPDVASFHTRTSVRAVVGTGQPAVPAQSLPGMAEDGFTLRAAGGAVESAGYVVAEGRMFGAPGEAVAAWGLFRRLGLEIGDTLTVRVDGRPLTLTIVGRYLEDDDDGEVAMTSLDTVRATDSSLEPDQYFVDLRDGADGEAVAAALVTAAGYDFDAWTLAEEAEGDREVKMLRSVMTGLSAVLLTIALVNLLTTTLLTVRERRRDLAIFKTIGMSPRQAGLSVASSVAFLALLAALVGIPLGLLVYRVVFEVLVKGTLGAPPEWYTAPPAWQVALVLPAAVLVAALASAGPARHGAGLKVVDVLRYE